MYSAYKLNRVTIYRLRLSFQLVHILNQLHVKF